MTFLELLNKNLLYVFIASYLLFLMPYFLENNIPLQFDLNIIIIVFTLILLLLLSTFFIFMLIFLIERFLKIYNKEFTSQNDTLLLSFYDGLSLVLGIILPLVISLRLEITIQPYIVFGSMGFFCIVYLVLGFFNIKRQNALGIYINSLIIILIYIYLLFLNFDNMLRFLIFLFVLTILLFFIFYKEYHFYRQFDFLKNSYFYPIIEKYINTHKQDNIIFFIITKINIYLLVIVILICFRFWDSYSNDSIIIKFITNKVFTVFKVGNYQANLFIDKKFEPYFNDTQIKKSNDFFEINTDIIWQNDSYVFIKYKNSSLSINREFIPIIQFIDQNK